MKKISFILMVAFIFILTGCTKKETVPDLAYLNVDFTDKPDLMESSCTGIYKKYDKYIIIDGTDCQYKIHNSVIEEFPDLLNCTEGKPCTIAQSYIEVVDVEITQ